MKPNKYSTNVHSSALHGIATGVEIATSAVKSTLGARGQNVAVEMDEFPFVAITNDGAFIIDHIDLQDPLEKMGLNFLKEAVTRSNNNSGDGSTTTCVLLNAILQEGIKSGATGIELKKEIDSLLPEIIKLIDEQKKEITVESGLEAVATVAGESEELGKLLAEIYKKIGKDGIIHLEGSGTYDTSYDFIEGVRFNHTGYLSPYMVHDEQAIKENRPETKAVYENPVILVTKRKISTIADINPLLKTLEQLNKKDLVVFTDDMDSGVASMLIQAHKDHVMNICIIKAPTVWKNSVFEDFAKCTGSTIIEDATGLNFKNLPIAALGTCGTITVTKEETVLTGIKDIKDHIADLNTKTDTESLMRLSWLNNKTVLLRLGALSETDLFYKRLKCEDAIYSCRRALAGGIVAGGGVCLLNVSMDLKSDSKGALALKGALTAPIQQIQINAGKKPNLFMGFDTLKRNYGFNAKTGQIVDMYEAGIIDSADIVKGAVKNALGIASTILTTTTLISKKEETPEQIAYNMMKGQGLRM